MKLSSKHLEWLHTIQAVAFVGLVISGGVYFYNSNFLNNFVEKYNPQFLGVETEVSPTPEITGSLEEPTTVATPSGEPKTKKITPTPIIELTPTPPISTENNIDSPIPDNTVSVSLPDNSGSSAKKRKAISLKSGSKKIYGSKEKIKIDLFNDDINTMQSIFTNSKDEEVVVNVVYSDNQGITSLTASPPTQFRPGKYKLKIIDQTGSVIEQDFLWGVLAINPNKSIYTPGETANLAMAVLNENGDMVCDARVILKITDGTGLVSELSTDNKKIVINPECTSHDFTLKPDYETTFKANNLGNYNLELTAETSNGTYVINDSFDVQASMDFGVERISATRIYPPNNYPMTINITANKDFKGYVFEEVPTSFEINQPDIGWGEGYEEIIVVDQNIKKIRWAVDIKKGAQIKLGYKYKTPQISPQFYLTGPLTMATLLDLSYTENRQWQIAADAITPIKIRQEINILDGLTSAGTNEALVTMDTTKYSGATYFFEVVAQRDSGTLTVNLNVGNTVVTGIGITNVGYVRVRQQFTPIDGANDYQISLVNGTNPIVKSARIVIIQSGDHITATETQIEIGNKETGQTVVGTTEYVAPTFQAVGGSATATTTAISVAWPAHQIDDIALLFVETVGGTTPTLSVPSGFQQVSNSPQSIGTTTTGTTLAVFWARATSASMASPTIAASRDHLFAVIVTYRGCYNSGIPVAASAGVTKGTASTTTSFSSVTTSYANSLIVFAAARANDSASAAWGAVSNATIQSETERHDYGTASGNGGGILVADGLMPSGGVTNTSSATVTSAIDATMTIALTGIPIPSPVSITGPKYWTYTSAVWDPVPTFSAEVTWQKNDVTYIPPAVQAIGTSNTSTGAAISVAWPAHAVDDIALLFVETVGGTTPTLSVPSGFQQITNSPQSVGTTTTGTTLAVYWARATSASMASPTIAASRDHLFAVIVTYRGCVKTGNPWEATAGLTKGTASTMTYFPSVTTSTGNDLIVLAAARENDLAAAAWGVPVNGNIINMAKRHDLGTANGNGGGIFVADGVLQTASVGGTASTTVTSSLNTSMTIALKGVIDTTSEVTITVQQDNGSYASWTDVLNVVTNSTLSGLVTNSRGGTFVPVNGRHYRIGRTIKKNTKSSTINIYNAKIIANQADALAIKKLESQYLLLNTKTTSGSATGLSYNTLWDINEWSRTTNVYKHVMDTVGVGMSSALIDINNLDTVLTNSNIGGTNQIVSNNLTMPTSGHQIDTLVTGTGEINATRILVQATLNIPSTEFIQASFRWSNDNSGQIHGYSDWYDVDWDYRSPITVTNSLGVTLPDYQIMVDVGTSALIRDGKLRSDCGDLRFAGTDGVTMLNYWIDSGCNTNSTKIWVKVPTIVASGDTTIMMYYGNSVATSTANGENTFRYFDDFNDNSVDSNKWQAYSTGGTPKISESGGELKITGDGTYRIYQRMKNTLAAPYTLDVEARKETGDGIEIAVHWDGVANGTSYYRLNSGWYAPAFAYWDLNQWYLQGWYNSGNTIIGDASTWASPDNNFHNFETRVSTLGISVLMDGSQIAAIGDTTYSSGYVALSAGQESPTVYAHYDDFRIRQYAATEPTVSVGSETVNSGGTTWMADENEAIIDVAKVVNLRLRFSVSNLGDTGTLTSRLQVAPLGGAGNCEVVSTGNFVDVPTTSGVGTSVVVMTTSTFINNLEATTRQMTKSSTVFVAGDVVENPSNQSGSISLSMNSFTEMEYVFQFTTGATDGTDYCLRTANAATPLNTYTYLAKATISGGGVAGPTMDQVLRHGSWFLNGVRQPFNF